MIRGGVPLTIPAMGVGLLAPMAEIFDAPATYHRERPAGTTSIWLYCNGLQSRVEGRFEAAHCDLFLSSADEIVRRAKRVRSLTIVGR